MVRLSRTVHAIYRRTELRQSGPLEDGNFHIAYQDLSPDAMTAVSNICIAKGHRLISGFFGIGLLISGVVDYYFDLGTGDVMTLTKVFGFITVVVLLLASFSRNFVIAQQMRIIDSIIKVGGNVAGLASDDSMYETLVKFDTREYDVVIGSPIMGMSGIDLMKKEERDIKKIGAET
jgi:hypothetical protein